MSYWMYITISEEDRISIFEVDSTTGRVDHRGDVATPGRPAPLTVDPEGRFLYVGCRTALELLTFRIDPANGSLSEAGRAAIDSDPCYLATDRSGRYLMSAHYLAGGVAVHRIGSDGVAAAPPVQWLATAPGAHSIQTDQSNRFAFVPHIAGAEEEDIAARVVVVDLGAHAAQGFGEIVFPADARRDEDDAVKLEVFRQRLKY